MDLEYGRKRTSKRVRRESQPNRIQDTDDLLSRSANAFAEAAHSHDSSDLEPDQPGFETTFSLIANNLLAARHQAESKLVIRNEHGHLVRPISRIEADQLVSSIAEKQALGTSTGAENILLRRLSYKLPGSHAPSFDDPYVTESLPPTTETCAVPSNVQESSTVKSTPFDRSFASRLYGSRDIPKTVFFQDWETMSPWMELMADIMDHYRLSQGLTDDDPAYTWAPVTYTPVYAFQLPQIHDLLERSFWPGIDVSDSVHWEPEQCSIVASYKKLVVGCAFLSETMEPYVTYITVRAGWEGAGIATFMLYHLIKQNPGQDIVLHVSATNRAMLLYNRFGFKAEEFIAGFYNEYLGEETKLCKNALRLRYRR